MKILNFVFSFFILINSQTIFAQDELLSCRYSSEPTTFYTCYLTIQNPNGLNNFQDIDGVHEEGMTDEDVVKLEAVSGSFTPNIPSIFCEKFKNLNSIVMKDVGIAQIGDLNFNECKKLFLLDFGFNSISKVHENSFVENLELQFLNLNDNQITVLPENLFVNQQKLGFLWLNGNKIQDLPANIFRNLGNLYQLLLNENQISKLRVEWFKNLENLSYLILNSNQIEELPENVFTTLKSLYQIELNENRLRVVNSNSFPVQRRLQRINLGSNQVDAFDEMILDNTSLDTLNMESNICANASIVDYSFTRQSMRSIMRQCFENFKNISGGEDIFEIYWKIFVTVVF